jgi:NADH dehydrogenase FAD-containing subunit
MAKHLVLAGGGHAHLTMLKELATVTARGHRVTLVSPEPFHSYSGMGPGLLGGSYRPEEVRFDIRAMTERAGGVYIAGDVERVDAASRRLLLHSGAEIPYDVASFNLGSRVPLERLGGTGPGVVPVKPIAGLAAAREQILATATSADQPLRLLVVGGGPAGVEIAGNLCRLVEEHHLNAELTLVAGSRLLGGFPPRLRTKAFDSLSLRQVTLCEGCRVVAVNHNRAVLDDGRFLAYDFAFVATGIVPPSVFRQSQLPVGPDGGLLVNAQLQSVGHPELFGGGDCIHFAPHPLDKVGVHAVRQNPILLHNLLAALENKTLQSYAPQRDYLLIFNLGDGRGLLRRNGFIIAGRPAFRLKDWIDRRFMRRFQVSGECD